MEAETGDTIRVQQLEQLVATLQAKLHKSDTVKKKLREHLALLKEKAINSLALVEEQFALQQEHAQLQQQYEAAAAAVSQLQQAAQEAEQKQAAAEAAKSAAEEQYHAVLKDFKFSQNQLRTTEESLSKAIKASMKAKEAARERDEALAGMQAMQQQIQQLQLAVRQLQRSQPQQQQQQQRSAGKELPPLQPQQQQQQQQQELSATRQQQLAQKVQQLEAWVRGLLDMDIEIDVNDMYHQLQRSVVNKLNAEIDSRLDGLQQSLAQLQQQQKLAEANPTATASATDAAGLFRSPLDRPATQQDVQLLQQQMEALAAQQQHSHALLHKVLADRKATAADGLHSGRQDESCCLPLAAVASAGPTPDTLPAAAAAAGGVPVAAASRLRGSSMYGSTALVVGGTSSSYADDQIDSAHRLLPAGSPSVGTATPRHSGEQQQQQLSGAKRRQEDEEGGEPQQQLDPWEEFVEINNAQMQLPASTKLPPLPQQQPGRAELVEQLPSKCARVDIGATAAAAAAAQQQQASKPASHDSRQQQEQREQEQQLVVQLLAVRTEQACGAAVAQQLAGAVEAGTVQLHSLLQAFATCFKVDAAPEYEVQQLQHVLTGPVVQQLQQQLPRTIDESSRVGQVQQQQRLLLRQLCTAGWGAHAIDGCKAAAANTTFEAQQRLADCAYKLSAALHQQHCKTQPHRQQHRHAVDLALQSGSILKTGQLEWRVLAECWQADRAEGCSCCLAVQQDCSGPKQLSSSDRSGYACTDRPLGFLEELVHHVMAPVYLSVGKLGAAVLEAQQQQQQQQRHSERYAKQQPAVLPLNVAQACAAAAAAVQLYRAAGQQQSCLQLIAKLLSIAAAYTWPKTITSSSSTCQGSPTAEDINASSWSAMCAGAAGRAAAAAAQKSTKQACGAHSGASVAAARQCSRLGLACLLAAAASWPDMLQLPNTAGAAAAAAAATVRTDTGVLPLPRCAVCRHSCGASKPDGIEHNSCIFWQWLVLDPMLVTVCCGLQHVSQAAATAAVTANAPGAQQFADSWGNNSVRPLAAALQLLLNVAPLASAATSPVVQLGSGAGTAADGVCVAGCPHSDGMSWPAVDELLGCLLGVLQVLLHEQPATLPCDDHLQPCTGDSAPAAAATVGAFVAAVFIVALLVPQQRVNALLNELRVRLNGNVSEWPVQVQRLLGHVAV